MYAELVEVNERPAPFSVGSPAELWTDEHVSSRMLALHLDGSLDVASRRTETIDRSVDWIAERFGLGDGAKVADFGCGPGLYASRLAKKGAAVTAIDFSERSIAYARAEAERAELAIDYVCADYLELESDERFDLVLMIMCDFCALGPADRARLLASFLRHLKPGGAALFDVYTLVAFAVRDEDASYAPNLMNGFWAAEPYFGFHNTFKYAAEKVILDKYTIVREADTRVVHNWLQHFDPAALRAEVDAAGFELTELLGSVAGDPLDPESPEMAILATKPA